LLYPEDKCLLFTDIFTSLPARDSKRAAPYFKPGASGSPLIYKDHIIGLVPWQNLGNPYEVAAVVFSGTSHKGIYGRIRP